MYLAIRIFYGRVPKNAILVGFYYESSMILYKVEVGSAMYKEGFRWTESIDIHGETGISQCMVLDYILTISIITIAMLIIIIIPQVLGHTNFNQNTLLENNMNISMNKVNIRLSSYPN